MAFPPRPPVYLYDKRDIDKRLHTRRTNFEIQVIKTLISPISEGRGDTTFLFDYSFKSIFFNINGKDCGIAKNFVTLGCISPAKSG